MSDVRTSSNSFAYAKEGGKRVCTGCKQVLINRQSVLDNHLLTSRHKNALLGKESGKVMNKSKAVPFTKTQSNINIKTSTEDGSLFCIICAVKLNDDSFIVQKHLSSAKHLKNQRRVDDENRYEIIAADPSIPLSRKISRAEVKLAVTTGARHLAYLSTNYSVATTQKCFDDSIIARNIEFERKKCSLIIRKVIAPAYKLRISEILKRQSYCFSIDESTDVANRNMMVIMIRYYNNKLQWYSSVVFVLTSGVLFYLCSNGFLVYNISWCMLLSSCIVFFALIA